MGYIYFERLMNRMCKNEQRTVYYYVTDRNTEYVIVYFLLQLFLIEVFFANSYKRIKLGHIMRRSSGSSNCCSEKRSCVV